MSFRGLSHFFITLTLGSNQLQVRVFLSPTNVKSMLGTGLFTGFSYMNRLLFISHSFSIDPLHLCIGSSFHFLEIGLITHSHELVDKIFQIVLLPVTFIVIHDVVFQRSATSGRTIQCPISGDCHARWSTFTARPDWPRSHACLGRRCAAYSPRSIWRKGAPSFITPSDERKPFRTWWNEIDSSGSSVSL